YPFAAINLMRRLSELTRVRVSHDSSHEVNYWVVRITDPELFECPFLIGTDVGTLAFSDEEVKRLREYLLKGGFLWVDDFWGTQAWNQWEQEIAKVLPPEQYPIEDISAADPIMREMFDLEKVPQITNVTFWLKNNGKPSERDQDSA